MEIFNRAVMDGLRVADFNQIDEENRLELVVTTPDSPPCPILPGEGLDLGGIMGGLDDFTGLFDIQPRADWADAEYGCEAGFLSSILGDSTYTRELAVSFVNTIRTRYPLNGRYVRAFWINPGYEWTPTQTAGKALFA
eukprot:2975583-Rhodomonas_salina.1